MCAFGRNSSLVRRKDVVIVFLTIQFIVVTWYLYDSPLQGQYLIRRSKLVRTETFTYRAAGLVTVFTPSENQLIRTCREQRLLNQLLCPELVTGELTSVKHFQTMKQDNKTQKVCSFESLLNTTKGCKLFLAANDYITDISTLTKEEKDFPLAITIKMHTNPSQVEQLLRTIYRPNNVYCIHVDNKTSLDIFTSMKSIAKCMPNIIMVEDRINVVYASIHHIKAEMRCMQAVMKSKVPWKYYINFAGQEFVLKTNLEIVRILKSLNGANDIESYEFPKNLKTRLGWSYYANGNLMVTRKKEKQPFKYKINFRKGSAYGAMRREFVQFVLNDSLARDFISWLEDTKAPEETIWSTLNALPWAPGGFDVQITHSSYNFLSRAMNWFWDKTKCQGHYVRSVCIMATPDLPWLVNSPEIIANKFDNTYDPVPLNCLEKIIRERTKNSELSLNHLNWYYYRNLPHSQIYANISKQMDNQTYLSQVKTAWLRNNTITESNITHYKNNGTSG